jgi:hypothetical protein
MISPAASFSTPTNTNLHLTRFIFDLTGHSVEKRTVAASFSRIGIMPLPHAIHRYTRRRGISSRRLMIRRAHSSLGFFMGCLWSSSAAVIWAMADSLQYVQSMASKRMLIP